MQQASTLNSKQEIGSFFTPILWGKFAVAQFGIFEKWLAGASIFDPTMGTGNLLCSLIDYAIDKGYHPKKLPIHNLYGVELNKKNFEDFFFFVKKKYQLDFPKENFLNEDIFFLPTHKKITPEKKFDILFGNPPWKNFVDLPTHYKEQLKPLFFEYDLVEKSQKLLLGYARIDIAALVLQKTIQKHLKKNGEAIFFLPLSLFFNEGAHSVFRKYRIQKIDFKVQSIFDFYHQKIFDKVSTRYGLVHFIRDSKQTFPINYYQYQKSNQQKNQWEKLYAQPIFANNDPLSVSVTKRPSFFDFSKIPIKKYSQPRQGINACGVSSLFFFDSYQPQKNGLCQLTNKERTAIIPQKYIFPLIIRGNFVEKNATPQKWVLLPYNKKGKILTASELEKEPLLWNYLLLHKKALQNRKGVFIQSFIAKKKWWALLGVGAYSFSFQKIVWEAYGKKTFSPKIFHGDWQANQSLQAFIPTTDVKETSALLQKLQNKEIENYLLSHQMAGTMNWAQPGKIKKLLQIEA